VCHGFGRGAPIAHHRSAQNGCKITLPGFTLTGRQLDQPRPRPPTGPRPAPPYTAAPAAGPPW
jgi:hypothetical protein